MARARSDQRPPHRDGGDEAHQERAAGACDRQMSARDPSDGLPDELSATELATLAGGGGRGGMTGEF